MSKELKTVLVIVGIAMVFIAAQIIVDAIGGIR
jgi:hypothetical protein